MQETELDCRSNDLEVQLEGSSQFVVDIDYNLD
jgi:hypothetical protein